MSDKCCLTPSSYEHIEPNELREKEGVVTQFVSIVAKGVFNLMGPIIFAINLITKPEAECVGIRSII